MSKKIGPAERRLQKEGKGPVSLSANLKNRAKKLQQINPNMKHPQKAHNGPFMMAPGNGGSIKSAQNSPGPFREDSSAAMFFGKQPEMKHAPLLAKPDFPDVDGDGDKKEPISKAQKDLQAQKKPRMGHSNPQMGHSNPQLGGMLKPNDYHK